MTDLRDQLADAILLNDQRRIGHVLWRLRYAAGYTADELAHYIRVSRSAVYRREYVGHLSAAALIEHLDALGYDLVAVPRTHAHRSAA